MPRRWRYRWAGAYPFPRFQIDPAEPTPRRDIRWPMLVLGFASLVAAGLLFAVYAIVSSATSGSGFGCGTTGPGTCVDPLLDYLFLVPAFVLAVAGTVLLLLVLRELR